MTDTLLMPIPLSAEEAYWHACTGTPYVPTHAPVVYDQDCSPRVIYRIPVRCLQPRRLGIIRDIDDLDRP